MPRDAESEPITDSKTEDSPSTERKITVFSCNNVDARGLNRTRQRIYRMLLGGKSMGHVSRLTKLPSTTVYRHAMWLEKNDFIRRLGGKSPILWVQGSKNPQLYGVFDSDNGEYPPRICRVHAIVVSYGVEREPSKSVPWEESWTNPGAMHGILRLPNMSGYSNGIIEDGFEDGSITIRWDKGTSKSTISIFLPAYVAKTGQELQLWSKRAKRASGRIATLYLERVCGFALGDTGTIIGRPHFAFPDDRVWSDFSTGVVEAETDDYWRALSLFNLPEKVKKLADKMKKIEEKIGLKEIEAEASRNSHVCPE